MSEIKPVKKILVTGGTGTLSSGLVQECVNKGYEVYALTRGNMKNRNIKDAIYLYADIRKPDSVKNVIQNLHFDVVVECLAYNVDQLKSSLEIFADSCDQYVFISTAGIYARNDSKRIKESDPKTLKEWDYTEKKLVCEEYLMDYCKKRNLIYTIIRPTVTYGEYRIPFPIATRSPGWTFFQRMLDGKPILAGQNVRFSVIHVEDFSRCVVALFGNKRAFDEDFHISSNDNDIYWDDVINVSGKLLGVNPMIIHVPVEDYRNVFPSVYRELKYNKNESLLLDDAKIKMVSGVNPEIDINSGIERILTEMKAEYLDNKLKLDDKWNERCDATIYYAFMRRHLCESEQKALEEYFDKNGVKEYRSNFGKAVISNLKGRIRSIPTKAKRVLGK